MKKLMMAIAAFGMLFTSCQNDADFVQKAGETATVSFEVGTPEIATRAYSDGNTATVLQYAVYNKDGVILPNLTKTDAEIHGSTTVELKLTTGNSYSVIFWAAAPDAPYNVDFATKTMTVDYTDAVSNDENRDAFFKYHEFTVTGAQTEVIELKRPFAQLNIGTNDYTASANAGYTPTKSSVTVKNLKNVLNLATGEVSGTEKAITFAEAAIPITETFPVAGNEYIAMNYVLVGADKEVVDVEFTYTDGSDAKIRTVGSVPVQRNHRTNIYGQLFTSDVDFNVIINPEYEEPSFDAADIELTAAFGGEYTAIGNVNMTADESDKNPSLVIDFGAVLNMEGFTLTAGDAKNYGVIAQNGSSVINDANIKSAGGGIGVVGGAQVEINGGSVTVNTTSTSQRYCVFAQGEGSVATINGGTYTIQTTKKQSYACAINGGVIYIKGGVFGAAPTHKDWKYPIHTETGGEVIITGGTFGFDPTEWVADGYEATQSGSTWTVAAK
jgi:hypothetical protein